MFTGRMCKLNIDSSRVQNLVQATGAVRQLHYLLSEAAALLAVPPYYPEDYPFWPFVFEHARALFSIILSFIDIFSILK